VPESLHRNVERGRKHGLRIPDSEFDQVPGHQRALAARIDVGHQLDRPGVPFADR